MERTNGAAEAQRGSGGRADGRGVDGPPERRPGVPMKADPHLAEGAEPGGPPRQGSDEAHLRRAGLPRLTPVYGTAQPPKGLSGVMRRAAYRIPEHSAAHWMMLLSADRLDILEDRLTNGLGPDTLGAMGRRIRTNPLPAIAMAVLAGALVRRAMR